MTTVEEMAAASPRCAWIGETLAWLEPDDVSLTYSATSGEVTRHAGGRAEVVGDDPFVVLEQELADGPADARWYGYFGYAARPDLPAAPDPHQPDAVWMRPSRWSRYAASPSGSAATRPTTQAVVGRVAATRPTTQTAVGRVAATRPTTPTVVGRVAATRPTTQTVVGRVAAEERGGVSRPPDSYREAFARVQEELHAGNSYEVNLTHRNEVASELDPATAYRRLRELNPAPYAGFLQHDVAGARAWLLSSSPERYALIGADRTIETKPIKGTTPRGSTPEEDEAARRHLATDPKFRAENLMIVDLLRNDLATVCEIGSVAVPGLMQVESYAAVHQLVSTVRGRLRAEVSTVHALRNLFPAGSMTGAPKLRTMQIIDSVEATPRGTYAGAFGWIDADGRADLGVVIRSLTTSADGTYRLGTGGGITVASDPDEEWAETRWKAERVLAALSSR
ncbi:MAG TPA: anthranilate synthase component I family protein [Nocardioides sp.]|nr:anthranilate synthase component I family protein [Nocardioides sp.]